MPRNPGQELRAFLKKNLEREPLHMLTTVGRHMC